MTWILVLVIGGGGLAVLPGYKSQGDCEYAFVKAKEKATDEQFKERSWMLVHICVPGPTP